MKIAVHFSGRIRTFKYCYPKMMEALKEHDVHIYISLWDIPGHSFKYKTNPSMAYPELEYKNITKEFILKEFPDLNFKVIHIEKYEKLSRSGRRLGCVRTDRGLVLSNENGEKKVYVMSFQDLSTANQKRFLTFRNSQNS